MQSFNYNTDVTLWQNQRKAMVRGEYLSVTDGHIVKGTEALGRFTTDEDAKRCLVEAGFKCECGQWIP